MVHEGAVQQARVNCQPTPLTRERPTDRERVVADIPGYKTWPRSFVHKMIGEESQARGYSVWLGIQIVQRRRDFHDASRSVDSPRRQPAAPESP